jgi:hypothetical protein
MMEGSTPEKPPTVLWIVVSDDSEDLFVATQADIVTGQPTGREVRLADLAAVTAYLAKQGAVRLPDDPEAPDDVVAQFVA